LVVCSKIIYQCGHEYMNMRGRIFRDWPTCIGTGRAGGGFDPPLIQSRLGSRNGGRRARQGQWCRPAAAPCGERARCHLDSVKLHLGACTYSPPPSRKGSCHLTTSVKHGQLSTSRVTPSVRQEPLTTSQRPPPRQLPNRAFTGEVT